MPLTKTEANNIRARLDRWELSHLRSHAAALAEQLEAMTARAEAAERQAENYERCADFWQENTHTLQAELQQLIDNPATPTNGMALGLTMSGNVVLLQPARNTVSAYDDWAHGTQIHIKDVQERTVTVLIREPKKPHTWYCNEHRYDADGKDWSTCTFGMIQDDYGQLVQVAA